MEGYDRREIPDTPHAPVQETQEKCRQNRLGRLLLYSAYL